jgi:ribosomal-protein-alanine N-acetyltransferase
MTLTVRYMRLADVPQVVAIDHQSFNPPWTARSYAYEISESTYSHMMVVEEADTPQPQSFWQRMLGVPPEQLRRIVSYGGLWQIADEAHISTIASHPQLRGRGFGEIALAGMVQKALNQYASYIVLEVRVSNVSAQKLYEKYDFTIFDLKKHYYSNNGEDAYDMRLNLADATSRQRVSQRFAALHQRMPFLDQYTQTARGR